MKNFLIVAGFLIILGLFLVLRAWSKNIVTPSSSTQVEVANTSFSPQSLKIKKNETVTWMNKSDEPIWPASNIHPTHQILPEFDPKRPIKSQDSWSFTFEKIGVWRYHDHLAPQKTGMVEVVE